MSLRALLRRVSPERFLALAAALFLVSTALAPVAAAAPKCEPVCVAALDNVGALADSFVASGDPGCKPLCLLGGEGA